jgi:RNA polymerase sigma-70 factor (ECF subfamily)
MLKLTQATDEAIEAIYRARHREFLRVAVAITGSVESGEDAVQEGLARALARRRTFRGMGPLEAWLWRIVINAARNIRRRGEPKAPVPVEPVLRDEEDERVRAALAQLPERQRLVLFLRYYADLDYATIGRALGIRTGTVSATLSQAQTALRKVLQAEEVRA